MTDNADALDEPTILDLTVIFRAYAAELLNVFSGNKAYVSGANKDGWHEELRRRSEGYIGWWR
jgi:hypothetical protein